MVKKKINKSWFRKRRGLFSPDLGYGWIPISWEGYVTVLSLILINAFSVFYFRLYSGREDSIIKFFSVLALSVIVFCAIAISKTKKIK